MFDQLTNDDIARALDELIASLGVKEDTHSQDLIELLQKRDSQRCVQEIAARMGLPIRIRLSHVPRGFRSGDTNRFDSTALARTDWTGRGSQAITAQVSLPQDIPMFGTSGLQGYTIHVRVSENCDEHPYTFVAIMAHELSHVLLACLRSPHKESEWHTDLVPIILGFRQIVQKGRTTSTSTTSGHTVTTQITTYGYLSDRQFKFACHHVATVLEHYRQDKVRLLALVRQVKAKLEGATQCLEDFRAHFAHLNSHRPTRMRKEHAERVVQLYAEDYVCQWEARIAAVRQSAKVADEYARRLDHHTSLTRDNLRSLARALELASDEIDQVTGAISEDSKILWRYTSLTYRLRRALRRRGKLRGS